jgi:large subunit ribosomal protein L6
MKVVVKGNIVAIDNFLGEKHTRNSVVVGNTKVKVKGDIVTIEGNDIEEVGQTAGNLEKATIVTGRDTRVFQDGIYTISKGVAQ